MTRIYIHDDSDNVIHASEENDEEFYDFMRELADAYEGDEWFEFIRDFIIEQYERNLPEIIDLRGQYPQ